MLHTGPCHATAYKSAQVRPTVWWPQASDEVRTALEADVERLRVQLDDAAIRAQQMGTLEEQVALLQEQCERLQGDKSAAELEMQV